MDNNCNRNCIGYNTWCFVYGGFKMKLKLIISGTAGIILFILGMFILNENLKYPTGWGFLISGLIIVYWTQKQTRRDYPMKKKEHPLFKLEEPKEEEKELSTDEKIDMFGADIKGMSEEFAKERDNELKRLKKEYTEMNKLKTIIEKNVMNEHKQYNQLKQNMAIVESMAKQKGILIEHKK